MRGQDLVRGSGFFGSLRGSVFDAPASCTPPRSICRQIKLCIAENWRTPAERYLASKWFLINFPGGVTR